MAEPVLFSFVQNHDPYIPRENEKKKKTKNKKTKKKLFTLIAESFWTYFLNLSLPNGYELLFHFYSVIHWSLNFY